MPGWNDIKGDAAPPQGSVPICLRGDLAQQAADLEREIGAAHAATANSIVGGGEAEALAERLAVLQQEMRAHTYRFTFRALPRRQWRDLVEAHPPREDRVEDRLNGVDMAAFPTVLIAASCVAIQPLDDDSPPPLDAAPVFTPAEAEELADRLTDGQVGKLFGCAAGLNRSVVDLPKSESASDIVARLVPNSRPPEPGA